jgi:dGTPase
VTRLEREELEAARLSSLATLSSASRGRAEPEDPDPLRTAFQRDRDRIVHTKAFRRLKHKTQVFVNPDGDHFVTRLTHTMQVTQAGRAMAAGLGLNEDLTEAICLAHDVGHSPFGHTGEDALSKFTEGEWLHSAHGVRLVSILEPLNLSWEVLDGVRAHSWKIEPPPATPEGHLCRFADRIAYLTHDVLDAVRAGVLTRDDLPAASLELMGEPGGGWIGTMVRGVIEESAARGSVAMAPGILEVMNELRAFMFERVYLRGGVQTEREFVMGVVRGLVEHYLDRPDDLPPGFRRDGDALLQNVIDFVAGMTDRFALRLFDRLRQPSLFDETSGAPLTELVGWLDEGLS